jgi:hypothetical protein
MKTYNFDKEKHYFSELYDDTYIDVPNFIRISGTNKQAQTRDYMTLGAERKKRMYNVTYQGETFEMTRKEILATLGVHPKTWLKIMQQYDGNYKGYKIEAIGDHDTWRSNDYTIIIDGVQRVCKGAKEVAELTGLGLHFTKQVLRGAANSTRFEVVL